MFEEIQARIPTLTPWMESCYGTQPFLHLGDHTILSSSGVQQGDPLGPLCFALQPIIEHIRDEVPGLNINAWYLDDGTLCGSAADLAKALKIVEDEGPSRGLQLNRRLADGINFAAFLPCSSESGLFFALLPSISHSECYSSV